VGTQLLSSKRQLDRRKLVYLVGASHPDRRRISQVTVPPAGALLDRHVGRNLLEKADGGLKSDYQQKQPSLYFHTTREKISTKDECKRNVNRVITHLILEVWTGLTGRRLPGRQCLPAQESAGAASLYGQVAPVARDGPCRIPGAITHRETLFGGFPHHLRRIRVPHQPVQDSHSGMTAALDERIPHRHPDVLVQELRSGVQHPKGKMGL
jgi:hypothetical protein